MGISERTQKPTSASYPFLMSPTATTQLMQLNPKGILLAIASVVRTNLSPTNSTMCTLFYCMTWDLALVPIEAPRVDLAILQNPKVHKVYQLIHSSETTTLGHVAETFHGK